jgi:hypothetical protein
MDVIRALYSSFDGVTWDWPVLVPEWIVGDFVILLLGVLVVGFIVKKEKRPLPLLLELFCFIFLYAAIYENLATVVGWYGYGQGLVMIFNVPLAVPLIEVLFVYAGIRFGLAMKVPRWMIPLLVGCFGVLADLTLDPVALAQVHGGIGRWSWFIGAGDVNFFGAPVYNYVGWFLLCGYAAAFILLGRWWYERSGYRRVVGVLYPPIAMIAALGLMVSPVSAVLLWLAPWFNRGGWTEYVMFVGVFVILAAILVVWRGRMRERLTWKNDYIIPVVFGGFYLTNVVFMVVAGRWDILVFSLPFIILHGGIFLVGFRGKVG